MADDNQKQMVRVEVIAQLFDLSVEQIYRLTKSGIIKSQKVDGESGRLYPFIETIKAYILHLKDTAAARNKTTDDIKEADLAKKELELRRLETKIALEEGEAHSTADVRRVWMDVVGSFKMRLHSFPHTMADRLVDIPDREEVAEILKDEIAALCELLVGYDPEAFYARNPDYEDGEMIEDPEVEEADA